MSVTILIVTVKLNVSAAAYRQTVAPLVNAILDAPGLRWKIRLLNVDRGEAGGIYLFDDEASVEAFLAGSVIAEMKTHPALAGLSARQFEVMGVETTLTHGPLGEGVQV